VVSGTPSPLPSAPECTDRLVLILRLIARVMLITRKDDALHHARRAYALVI
jgi:hypothetical protein